MLAVIERAEDATVLLKPEHQRLLDLLATPNSAAGLARQLGWSRQIVNYHLREMQHAGLIALREERKRGNCVERVMQRSAMAYLIGPQVLGGLGADPARVADRLSAAYLMAVAARTIKEVSRLSRAAGQAGKILPTLTLDTEVRFRSAAERSQFTTELAGLVAELVKKYQDGECPEGRSFRLTMGAYPLIPLSEGRTQKRDDSNSAA